MSDYFEDIFDKEQCGSRKDYISHSTSKKVEKVENCA